MGKDEGKGGGGGRSSADHVCCTLLGTGNLIMPTKDDSAFVLNNVYSMAISSIQYQWSFKFGR